MGLDSISREFPEIIPEVAGYGTLSIVYKGQEIKLDDVFSSIPR